MPKQRKINSPKTTAAGIFLGLLVLLIGTAIDLSVPGWGSGHWFTRFSEKWAALLIVFWLLLIGLAVLIFLSLFHPIRLSKVVKTLFRTRSRLKSLRWPLILFIAFFPAWFVFFSPWGGLFIGFFFRLLLFALSFATVGFLLTDVKDKLLSLRSALVAGVLLGLFVVLADAFIWVNNFPFALHWSEGNRLWDYSVVFARNRYNYSGPEPIFAWIDEGRQTLWGLPFLIPNVPIWAVRLWGAILVTVPYAILGWVAFRPNHEDKGNWIWAGIWVMIFLNQGPIYTPLVLAAILVAIARKRAIWIAIPLVFFAGHYAGISRFTWRFAPGVWAVMLTIGDAAISRKGILWRDWLRAAALGLAGIWTKGLPIIFGVIQGLLPPASGAGPSQPNGQLDGGVETLQGLQQSVTHQPFLFERLFPNPVYPPGVLIGILVASSPLLLLLIYLVHRGYWRIVPIQRWILILGLGAFFVVGVIASAKVGGGTDLHNLDMFLVGLILITGLAWDSGFLDRVLKSASRLTSVSWILGALVLLPAFIPFIGGKPLILPSAERTKFVLGRIQSTVSCARQHGEVLFMDQRQLITYGQVGDIPLVVDYEKKYVMDQALAGNEEYFKRFRQDLAEGRFSLIVSEREAILYKESDIESIGDSLIEENNAWVIHVTTPLLKYYESVGDFKDVAVEMFMPVDRNYDCP